MRWPPLREIARAFAFAPEYDGQSRLGSSKCVVLQ
jgi:hypothetical protein